MERGRDDNRRVWRVVSIYSDGRRHVEGPWMVKSATEGLVEDIRLYREENPLAEGDGDEPQLVVERGPQP